MAAGLIAALAAAGLVLSAAAGVDTSDEAWFLQVTSRVVDGDVLYRDVFYGSTPLAVWLAAPGVALFGSEVLVIKALTAAGVALLAGALAAGAGQAGLSKRAGVLLAVAFAVFAARLTIAPYVVLAMAAGAWAVVAAVAWRRSAVPWQLWAAGALVGASAASKYTIGFLALIVVAVAVREPRAVLRMGVASAALLALTLLPVLASGGFPRFVEYAFTAKGTYVDAGAYSYADAFRSAAQHAVDALVTPSADTWENGTRALPALLPLLAVGVWLVRRRHPLLLLCALASLAGAYPRFTTRHLAVALPAVILLAAVALPARARAAAAVVAVLWIAGNVVGGLLPKWDDATLTGQPHLRGTVVRGADLAAWREDAAVLREVGAPLFVVSAESGLLHLLSGVPNPTPFDYPYATALGRHGDARTADRIRRGEIPSVCVERFLDVFEPIQIVRAARETLSFHRDLSACSLYGGPNLATTLSRLR